MVYTGTMIEELFEAVQREERRTAARNAACVEITELSSPLMQSTEPEVWHGAA